MFGGGGLHANVSPLFLLTRSPDWSLCGAPEIGETFQRGRDVFSPKLDFLLPEPPPSCRSTQSEIWPSTAVTAHRWRWRSLTDGPICATDPGPPNIGTTQMVQSTSRVSNGEGGGAAPLSDQREAESKAKLKRLTVASRVTEVGFFQIKPKFVRKENCCLLSATRPSLFSNLQMERHRNATPFLASNSC